PRDRDEPAAPARHRAAAGGRILLAEDNEISALLARAVFESLGHTVTEVRDGHAAVEAARDEAGRFDVIFLDLHMPGLDGLAAAMRIRADERTAARAARPIIALTADTLPETRRAALAAGIDSLIEKPVAPDTLRTALDALADCRAAA
ncbi:MAG: response regulator, partial [Rhizobiales bacterium]|nr:response regulator [Hyphomicrobiales bacterium]